MRKYTELFQVKLPKHLHAALTARAEANCVQAASYVRALLARDLLGQDLLAEQGNKAQEQASQEAAQ